MNTCIITDAQCDTTTVDLIRPVAPKDILLHHTTQNSHKANEPFVLCDKIGDIYYWFPSGLVIKYDVNNTKKYTWNPPPSLKSVVEQSPRTTESFFRFYSDGRITWRVNEDIEEYHWSPDPIDAIPVEGVVQNNLYHCLDCLYTETPHRCITPKCSTYYKKKYLDNYYEDYGGY